ncbi:hypothetical protein PPERSA_03832 [Pseudocohnilembus persalinus]|uniref:Uncharacterized protein n=1 Tax=Pseudocohnilembus persalinus TaxID=266149 RepID=A0A0V0QUI0_PSEPJ|nr:hypothetical protein PPERSA_03832 [Pseudocohnilembus persalinus]|eukprot:KRX05895.1 hypothetical protein PPERSA_03832 [Pseudocohnilembus persalinus]
MKKIFIDQSEKNYQQQYLSQLNAENSQNIYDKSGNLFKQKINKVNIEVEKNKKKCEIDDEDQGSVVFQKYDENQFNELQQKIKNKNKNKKLSCIQDRILDQKDASYSNKKNSDQSSYINQSHEKNDNNNVKYDQCQINESQGFNNSNRKLIQTKKISNQCDKENQEYHLLTGKVYQQISNQFNNTKKEQLVVNQLKNNQAKNNKFSDKILQVQNQQQNNQNKQQIQFQSFKDMCPWENY